MKKLLTLLLLPLFFACSSDKKDEVEPTQDYTSFTFEHHEPTLLKSCIVAYLDTDNNYIKLDELGDLTQGKVSKEVKLESNDIKTVYLFTIDTKLDAAYNLRVKEKNTIIMDRNTSGLKISNKLDPKQYPQ